MNLSTESLDVVGVYNKIAKLDIPPGAKVTALAMSAGNANALGDELGVGIESKFIILRITSDHTLEADTIQYHLLTCTTTCPHLFELVEYAVSPTFEDFLADMAAVPLVRYRKLRALVD